MLGRLTCGGDAEEGRRRCSGGVLFQASGNFTARSTFVHTERRRSVIQRACPANSGNLFSGSEWAFVFGADAASSPHPCWLVNCVPSFPGGLMLQVLLLPYGLPPPREDRHLLSAHNSRFGRYPQGAVTFNLQVKGLC